jgi:TIR domain
LRAVPDGQASRVSCFTLTGNREFDILRRSREGRRASMPRHYGTSSMADIFVSYANEDRDRAKVVAVALEHSGWSVWWDREVAIGRTWDETIEEEIEKARSVVVLWSPRSVTSDWVKNEARDAKSRNPGTDRAGKAAAGISAYSDGRPHGVGAGQTEPGVRKTARGAAPVAGPITRSGPGGTRHVAPSSDRASDPTRQAAGCPSLQRGAGSAGTRTPVTAATAEGRDGKSSCRLLGKSGRLHRSCQQQDSQHYRQSLT